MNEWITDWMNEQKHEKHERTGKVMECNEHEVKWSEVKWINEWLSEWMTTYLTDFAGATKVAPSVPEKTSARGQESYVSMF